MKRFILRLMLMLTGYAKEHRQLYRVKFIVGKTPSQIRLEVWDFNHDGGRDIEISVYYKNEKTHEKFQFTDLKFALAEFSLAEKFIGKEVL